MYSDQPTNTIIRFDSTQQAHHAYTQITMMILSVDCLLLSFSVSPFPLPLSLAFFITIVCRLKMPYIFIAWKRIRFFLYFYDIHIFLLAVLTTSSPLSSLYSYIFFSASLFILFTLQQFNPFTIFFESGIFQPQFGVSVVSVCVNIKVLGQSFRNLQRTTNSQKKFFSR